MKAVRTDRTVDTRHVMIGEFYVFYHIGTFYFSNRGDISTTDLSYYRSTPPHPTPPKSTASGMIWLGLLSSLWQSSNAEVGPGRLVVDYRYRNVLTPWLVG